MTAVAPLKIGRFRVMWIAPIFSNLGSFFYSVAASWLMLEMTGSATWVGLMQSSNTLPLLFLGLTAGALADLADRRRVMLYSQTLMGVAATAMAVLTFLDLITPPLLLGLGLVIGVGVAFNLPSWQAIVPNPCLGMLASWWRSTRPASTSPAPSGRRSPVSCSLRLGGGGVQTPPPSSG